MVVLKNMYDVHPYFSSRGYYGFCPPNPIFRSIPALYFLALFTLFFSPPSEQPLIWALLFCSDQVSLLLESKEIFILTEKYKSKVRVLSSLGLFSSAIGF